MSFLKVILCFKRKYYLTIFVLLVLLYLINNKYFMSKKTKIIKERLKSRKNENSKNIFVRLNNEWVINENILQYSSYLVIKQKQTYAIESLIFYDQNNPVKEIICVLKDTNNYIKLLPVTDRYMHHHDTEETWVSFGKVICEFQDEYFDTQGNTVAIIDIQDYGLEPRKQENLNQTLKYVIFQIPDTINAIQPKKQELAHCVHMVYDIHLNDRLKSVINWITLQKELGYKSIRMYVYRYNAGVDKILLENYSANNFLQIINFELKIEQVCHTQFQLVKQNVSKNEQNTYKRMLDLCVNKFKRYFEVLNTNGVFGLQSKICTNDCYMSYRHTFELVTNYDFDELIIPRNLDVNRLWLKNDSECRNVNQIAFSFNLYDYAIRLFQINARNNASFLMFKNAFTTNISSNLDNFIRDIEFVVNNGSKKSVVKYHEDSLNKVEFFINDQDIEYARKLIENYKYAKCLYSKLPKNILNYNFNRFFTIILPIRSGKSIFNTNYTEIINQHSADVHSHEGRGIHVSTELTFVSHFRESYSRFLTNLKLSIRNAIIDIDYLLLIYKSFSLKDFFNYNQ